MVRHRGSGLLFTLIALGMAIGSRPAHGQTISFLHPLSGVDPNASSPGVGGIAADTSGVYVVLDRGVLAKFDSHGNVLWTRATGAYNLWGPAADGAGVYVSGRIYNEPNPVAYFVRRYDPGGNELWTLQTDAWFNPVADASGFYVAGALLSGQTIADLYLRKYDVSGAEQWTHPFVTPKLGIFRGVAMAVDATGLYVAGGDDSSTTMGKYDASGNQLWSRQILASLDPIQRGVVAMAADGTGVYLVNPGADYFLRKFDASGNEVWARPVGAVVRALAADATGIYVVGLTGSGLLPGQCRTGLGGDAFVRKHNADGAELWTRESLSASYSGSSQATSVAMDDTGVYVDGGGTSTLPTPAKPFSRD
ncbi:MAG TPA: PQQ-binding-like beta-propeller repeat protein [Bryobacteraceae bacterium]|nr:PQQ-binding-like beta-propeller repeat protein [Bryobacteraceae bacterium]